MASRCRAKSRSSSARLAGGSAQPRNAALPASPAANGLIQLGATRSRRMRRGVLRFDAAPSQRVAQEKFDLRVDAAQLALSEPLERGPQLGIDAQQKGLL